MLQLVLGTSGHGKTEYLINKIDATDYEGVIKNNYLYNNVKQEESYLIKLDFNNYEIDKKIKTSLTNNKMAHFMYDDNYIYYRSSVQITLVSKNKDLNLEEDLEQALLDNGLVFSLLSESKNSDRSISRIYEIYMEEI